MDSYNGSSSEKVPRNAAAAVAAVMERAMPEQGKRTGASLDSRRENAVIDEDKA